MNKAQKGVTPARLPHQVEAEERAGLLDGLLVAAVHHVGRRRAGDGLRPRADGARARAQLQVALERGPAAPEVPPAPHGLDQRGGAVPSLDAQHLQLLPGALAEEQTQ